jgi:hypothetical protein
VKDPVLRTPSPARGEPGTGPRGSRPPSTGRPRGRPTQEVRWPTRPAPRKLAVRIRQIVSAAIETQVKDPRLGMVTVTDAG